MRFKTWIVVILILCAGTSACVHEIIQNAFYYDKRPLMIQSLSLFNQRKPSLVTGAKSWKSDWLFRRERLKLIDQVFKNFKPNIILFQSLMNKKGDYNKSDLSILQHGSLSDYTWSSHMIRFYEDTWEEENLSISISYPLRFYDLSDMSDNRKEAYLLQKSGFDLIYDYIIHDDEPVLIINVTITHDEMTSLEAYKQLISEIKNLIQLNSGCANRIVLGGYFPNSTQSYEFNKFLNDYDFKPAIDEQCSDKSNCYTSSSSNSLLLSQETNIVDQLTDMIYINKEALILNAQRNFTETEGINSYLEAFKIPELNASDRYGWVVNTKLPKCKSLQTDKNNNN